MTAETESVRQSDVHSALLSLVEGEIQLIVNFRVEVIVGVIDSRRHDVARHRLHAEESLEGAGSTEQVSGHRLRRAYIQFISIIAPKFLDSLNFRQVAYGSPSAVSIDLVNVGRFESRIFQSVLHYELCT